MAQIGGYVLRQRLSGRKRFPLVLMLEPLFRCNLACAGCGKIDYPDEILNQRLPLAECLNAIDECGAPVVVIAGGEPLLHKELPQIVEGAIARRNMSRSAPMRCCSKRTFIAISRTATSTGRSILMAMRRCTISRYASRASTTAR